MPYKRSAKLSLIAALAAFLVVMILVTDLFARHAVEAARAAPGDADEAQTYVLAFLLMGVFVLFTTLPLLMIVAYRGLQGEMLSGAVMRGLSLCALDDDQVQSRLTEYEERNSVSAFFLPSMVNLLLMYLVWTSALVPQGIDHVLVLMGDSAHNPISFALLLTDAAKSASPLTWALLGAYFYALTLIVRRWMLADLTTNVLWKINVRIVLTVILGSLLVALGAGAEGATGAFGEWAAALGFMVGIVPDLFLRWVAQQLKRVGGIDAEETGLFAPSELQSKLDGISFWQVDRLGEEGIESVHDLAMKEIPSLLIKTRFDTALLLNWVDRALLCTQVDDDLPVFKCAHLSTGTDLMAVLARPDGMATLLQGLHDGAANCAARGVGRSGKGGLVSITAPMIENIVSGLTDGPNLRHVTAYRRSTGVGVPTGVTATAPAALDSAGAVTGAASLPIRISMAATGGNGADGALPAATVGPAAPTWPAGDPLPTSSPAI
jgi:hypothetical protein